MTPDDLPVDPFPPATIAVARSPRPVEWVAGIVLLVALSPALGLFVGWGWRAFRFGAGW